MTTEWGSVYNNIYVQYFPENWFMSKGLLLVLDVSGSSGGGGVIPWYCNLSYHEVIKTLLLRQSHMYGSVVTKLNAIS